MRKTNGFSLLEMIVALAIIGVLALCAAPAFATYRRRASMTSQVVELQGIFRSLRMRAVASNRNAGVKFTPAGNQWAYSLYEDGDGDGIRSDDIASGVDRRIAGPSMLAPQFHIASIALLPSAIPTAICFRQPHRRCNSIARRSARSRRPAPRRRARSTSPTARAS